MDWKLLSDNWAAVSAAPLPFLAALGTGIVIGWIVVQLIYNTRLAHQQDVIGNLRAVLEDKLPARVLHTTPRLRTKRMAFGFILIFVGLLAAFLGALLLISERSSSPTAKLEKTDNPASAKSATATSQGPTLAAPQQSASPSPGRSAPTGTEKIIVEGLTKAHSDLLSIKKENLTCAALSEWQNSASATTRLAHATGIGIHNPISNYLGACQGIADVEKLEAIRDSVSDLLKRGIDAAGGQSSTVNGPINAGIGINNGTVNNLLPSAPSQTPAMRQTTLILQDAVSKCMNRDGMPGDDASRRKWLEPCINDLLASQGQPWKYEAATDLFIRR